MAATNRPPIERRVTPWWVFEDRPEWAGSDLRAVRIWIEFDGRHWYQLHEWEKRDGNRERFPDGQGWINGLRGWGGAQPTSEEPPLS